MIEPRYPSGEDVRGPLHRLIAREQLTGVNAALAWTALAISATVPVVLALPVGSLAKLLAALAFACMAPGAAVLCQVRLGSASVSWAISMVLSMSIVTVPGAVMLWADYWRPFAAFYVLIGASIAAALVGLTPTVGGWTPRGRRIIADAEAARLRTLANRPGPRTEVLAAIPAEIAQTSMAGGALDATALLPAMADFAAVWPSSAVSGADATRVIPKVVDAVASDAGVGDAVWPSGWVSGPDATRVIPKVVDTAASDAGVGDAVWPSGWVSGPDATRVIPKVVDAAASDIKVGETAGTSSAARDATQIIPAVTDATTASPATGNGGPTTAPARDPARAIPAARDAVETLVLRLPRGLLRDPQPPVDDQQVGKTSSAAEAPSAPSPSAPSPSAASAPAASPSGASQSAGPASSPAVADSGGAHLDGSGANDDGTNTKDTDGEAAAAGGADNPGGNEGHEVRADGGVATGSAATGTAGVVGQLVGDTGHAADDVQSSDADADLVEEVDSAVSGEPSRWLTVANVVILAGAVGCWITSLLLSSTVGVGDYGLLSVMHPTFFVGLCLCVVGFFVEIARGAKRAWLLAGFIVLLLLIMHATVPVLVREPEYAWTYKHIGVIQVFRVTGHILDHNDIYQAWPTFFAGVAQLGTWSGASTVTIAAWAPLFFDAANCVPLFAIVQTLTGDRRLPYITVFVFTCVNWVAQDYLSPQAFAYVLCLGTILVMVRWLRRRRGPNGYRFRLLGRAWHRLHEGLESVPYVGKRTERAALGCLYFVFAVVVISHQLSPYLIALSAGALVLLGLLRTWQVVPILLGIAVIYLLPNYSVADQYGVFDGIDIFHNLFSSAKGTAPVSAHSTSGEIFSAQAVHLLSLFIWGVAVIAVLVSRRRLGPVALPAVLAFAPFATLLGQTYGGEAIYRVYLFSAPWCVYLICRLALRLRRITRTAGVAAASALVFVGALIGMQGEHGQLSFDQFSPAEVQAAEYLYTSAPKGSVLVDAASNEPSRLTARYNDFNGGGDLYDLKYFLPTNRSTITTDDLARIDEHYANTPNVYVIISKSQIAYAHYFGYLPDGLIESLQRTMDASTFWKAVYRNDDAVIYKFMN